ncbi:MAG: prepilin-type N-terminal cleavage/methylation domain-containing protein [Candidatus Binatia bacterium]
MGIFVSHLTDHEKGFTLIEVLVAVTLISIGVLSFSLSTTGIIRGNAISAHFTTAINLAQDKIEQLKTQASLLNVNSCPVAPEQAITSSAAELKITALGTTGGIYNRCWTIRDSSLGAGLKEVSVTVNWQDYQRRYVTLSTLVFAG